MAFRKEREGPYPKRREQSLRDRKEALEKEQKEKLKPYTKLMSEVEGLMLDYLNRTGTDNVSGPGGTAYKSTVPRCTIQDREAFRNFVVAMAAFDLVDWRANAKAVQQHIAENTGTLPPGVNFSTYTSVRFRRPGEE